MKIETKKKDICINRIVTQKTEKFDLEEDVIIPDIKPDILKALSESGNVCIFKKEILDGRIKLDGSVNVYLVYLADSEKDNIRGINTNIDFKETFECKEAKKSMDLYEKICIKSIECKVLNGRKISLKVELEVILTLYSNENISIVNNIENVKDIQTRSRDAKINSLVGANTIKTYAKETIKINTEDKLAEILKLDINIVNKDIKISYNKVLAKADAEIKIMYLTEDNRINTVEAMVPVMGFIEMPDISDDNICDVKYTIKNILIKPNPEEEHSIYIELEMEIVCYAFKEEEVRIINDLYSPTRNLEYELKNIKTSVKRDSKNGVFEIKEKIQIPELVGEKIYNINAIPTLNNSKISNDKILFEGDLKINAIISANNETTIELITKEIPFVYTMEFEGINDRDRIETHIDVSMQNFETDNTDISLNINLKFEVSKYEQLDLNIIEEVTESEKKCEDNPYSMTIYFVKQGDSLWKIAKKFKSTTQDIAKLNNIEDPNKIDIGMQLFIPKYVCKESDG